MHLTVPRSLTARLMAWLVLAVFAARAVIPAGFMLDVAALAADRYSIVICSPEGLKTITLDANGAPVSEPRQQGKHQQAEAGSKCPFAIAITKALPLPEFLAAVLPLETPRTIAWRIAALELPPILAGPPAGARAPPPASPTTI